MFNSDYGVPIYNASSRVALLAALEGCITGHESLLKAGFLHRDISINNLMINECNKQSRVSSFLIDLDHAIKIDRKEASSAKGMVGTRPFMAIGVLMGEDHSFMHDLESFFWVLFWTCIHYDQYGEPRKNIYTEWNEVGTTTLAKLKKAEIDDGGDFIRTAEEHFAPHYRKLIPCVNKLREAVFPDGKRWRQEDHTLYLRMKNILHEAQNDPDVIAD